MSDDVTAPFRNERRDVIVFGPLLVTSKQKLVGRIIRVATYNRRGVEESLRRRAGGDRCCRNAWGSANTTADKLCVEILKHKNVFLPEILMENCA